MRSLANVVMAVLLLSALVSLYIGFQVLKGSKGAPQEIEGLVLFLTCAVSLSGAGIIGALTPATAKKG